jgi:hypothetical protein
MNLRKTLNAKQHCGRFPRTTAAPILSAALMMTSCVGAAGASEPESTLRSSSAVASSPQAALNNWSTRSEVSGSNYRWSLSRGALDLGLRFDMPSGKYGGASSPLRPTGPFASALPSLSLGLRTVDVPPSGVLKQLSGEGAPQAHSQRLGIEWKPAESDLLFLRQGLGVRLSGDDRLTMRLKKGALGIYLKQEF